MNRRFAQVEVFTDKSLLGNPLAVVIDADGLSDDEMAAFARWMNLSVTTFLLPAHSDEADYRVKIFNPAGELPFAGLPTLGTCAMWLATGGTPRSERIVQECGVGLVPVRNLDGRLAFQAPPLLHSGTVDETLLASVQGALATAIVDSTWADDGPGWLAVEVTDVDTLRGLRPDFSALPDLNLGVIARCDATDDDRIEVRAFFPDGRAHTEDPATGSLNASVAQWLMGKDSSLRSYTARQGMNLGRECRLHIDRDDDDVIWVGGSVSRVIDGTVDL